MKQDIGSTQQNLILVKRIVHPPHKKIKGFDF